MDIEKLNKILDKVFTPDIDKIISEQDIIGMRLSGGIDSAFLCFLTMSKYPNKKILPITLFNQLRPAAMDVVDNVLNALSILKPENENLLHSDIAFFTTEGFKKNQKMIDNWEKTNQKYNPKDVFQREHFWGLWEKYHKLGVNLNIYLSGETLNPPVEEQPEIITHEFRKFPHDRNTKKDKLFSKTRDKYFGHHKYEFRPFRNWNKKEVADMVRELGLDKTLFPVTESCETEIHMYPVYAKEHNRTYRNPGKEPCKICWPCREKYWAYGVYDFNSPETMERYKISTAHKI